MLHLLTGSNVLSYKVSEDPSRNTKLFSMIKNCCDKDYFVSCCKNKHKLDMINKGYPIYKIDSV